MRHVHMYAHLVSRATSATGVCLIRLAAPWPRMGAAAASAALLATTRWRRRETIFPSEERAPAGASALAAGAAAATAGAGLLLAVVAAAVGALGSRLAGAAVAMGCDEGPGASAGFTTLRLLGDTHWRVWVGEGAAVAGGARAGVAPGFSSVNLLLSFLC